LPPRTEFEDVPLLRKAAEARAALAELKGRCVIIPNPLMLINTIVLQEAKASSEIENIITTNDKLYKAFSSGSTPGVDSQTKEVLRYREALQNGFEKLKNGDELNEELFVNIVQLITENKDGIREFNGRERTIIGNVNKGIIIYTPPEGTDIIKSKLNNLNSFIADRNDNIEPLVKLAIAHYQFEAIHPFKDGNGRTGRILNSLFLVKYNLLELPILYLSKYIIDNKTEYYSLLRGVTEKFEWKPWILYILEAIKNTSEYTLSKINSIKSLLDRTIDKVKTELPKIYSKELVEQLFFQPYCKINFLVDNKISGRNAASRYLNSLTNIGILEKQQIGKENLYLNTELFDILSH
jgi:Fic family protein